MTRQETSTRAVWTALSAAALNGRRPTYRELMAHAGIRGSGRMQAAIGRLVHLGYARRGPRAVRRSLSVVVPLITLPDCQAACAPGAEKDGPAE